MRPVCVKCQREMIPIQNEFLVKDEATEKFPATYWYGDLYECPSCNNKIVTGFGQPLKSEPKEDALEFER